MPLYVYRCDAGHEFEAVQRITDEPLTECAVTIEGGDPYCGCCDGPCAAPARRVLQPFSVHGGPTTGARRLK